MTREEAARILKADDVEWNEIFDSESGLLDEALDMAIEALEQEPCEDCISRQAAIDTIESWLTCDDYNEAERHIMRAMQSVLYDLPSVTPKGKTSWIPVSERLPEDFQRVLVTIVNYKGDKVVRVAEYYNYNNDRKGIFHINENHEQWEVGEKGLLAWMPLPEPYKADKEAEDD